jgi:hypothetical protein
VEIELEPLGGTNFLSHGQALTLGHDPLRVLDSATRDAHCLRGWSYWLVSAYSIARDGVVRTNNHGHRVVMVSLPNGIHLGLPQLLDVCQGSGVVDMVH